MAKSLDVPRHEPEVLEAAARRLREGEKLATTALHSVTAFGVVLSSRDQKAEELELMAAVLEGMDPRTRSVVTKAWCDSKAEACYTLTLWRCDNDTARTVADQFEKGCIELGGGHNGIHVERAGGRSFALDPWWDGCS
jgi:hypothetical protein